MENVPSPILVVVEMGVEGEDASLHKLSLSGTRVLPMEGIASGMILETYKFVIQSTRDKDTHSQRGRSTNSRSSMSMCGTFKRSVSIT